MKDKSFIFKIMYAINILAAGIPGFLIVFFPSFGEQYVLWEGQDYSIMTILGSIWLAIAIASIFGIFNPYRFLVVFMIQFFYKSIWLMAFILPTLMKGEALPPSARIIIGIFTLLIVECLLFIRPKDFISPPHLATATSI